MEFFFGTHRTRFGQFSYLCINYPSSSFLFIVNKAQFSNRNYRHMFYALSYVAGVKYCD